MTSDLFALPSEYQALRESVRALAEKEIAPHAHAVDEDHRLTCNSLKIKIIEAFLCFNCVGV